MYFFRSDILNVLRSTHCANEGMADLVEEFGGVPGDIVLRAYRKGFDRALASVGLAVGIEVQEERRLTNETDPSSLIP